MTIWQGIQFPVNRRAAGLGVVLGLTALLALAFVRTLHGTAAAVDTTRPGSLSGGEVSPAPIHSTAILFVATSADYEPMEYISGTQIVGHDIDLMDALAAQMGVTVIYTNVTFSHIISGLLESRYDAIISTMSATPEREQIVDFTLPYLNINDEPIAIAVQEGDDSLRRQMNDALRVLRAGGTLSAMAAAVAADMPDWQVRLPEWPYAFLPLVVRDPE